MRWREANPELFLAQKREKYIARKVEQTCTQCDAGLQEDDGVLCVECTEINRETSRRYQAKPEVKAKKREQIRERLADGRCYHCDATRAPGDKTFCARHRAKQNEYNARSYATRRQRQAGIIPITERAISKLTAREVRAYQPHDELAQKPRVRILLALSWRDWTSAAELIDVLGVDTSNGHKNTENDNYRQMLSRLARHGFLDRRSGVKGWSDYRINDRGRAEVQKIRNGDLRTRFKRAA